MNMIRWLATNKVVLTVWGLGLLTMLLALVFGGGDKADAVETKVVETVTDVATPVVATVALASTALLAAVDTATEAAVETASDVISEAVVEVAVTTEQVEVFDATAEVAQDAMAVEASIDAVVAEEGDLSGKSNDDLLMMAREAYWDNGLDQAAILYSELITREPTIIEHKGELGNVFWRQGYPKKAAELYADIAGPMIAQGNGERVSNMVGFIGLFFPERATDIRKQLDTQ